MRSLDKPTFNVRKIIEDCTSNLREGSVKYLEAIPEITEYSNLFDIEMCRTRAWTLSPHESITPNLTKNDMVDIYTNKFSKDGQPGRKYYDRIKLAPTNGICPICGIGDVSTLDHYMAKSLYPKLSITPINLVPACRDCNTIRGTQVFSSDSDMTLHPYYDDVQNTEWLAARIISLDPICVEYYISDGFLEQPMRNRLEKHLKVFELDRRFSQKAAEELSSIKHYIQVLLNVGGIDALRSHFEMQYRIHSTYEKNSWKSALYQALINVDRIIVDGQML